MPSPEVFYLHLDGSQRGPYTVPQIDHLLNSGLIPEETLYWREGLEQWAPVTSLVEKRVRRKPWRKILLAMLLLAALGLITAFVGPVLVDGWRETNQYSYTPEAAYWRAREVIRSQSLPRGASVRFADFSDARVELDHHGEATALVRSDVLEDSAQTRSILWKVRMKFDAERAEWSSAQAPEVAQ